MARFGDPVQIWSRRKATAAFFPYAVSLERGGESRMLDAFLGVTRASGAAWFLWKAIEPFVATLFDKSSPDSLNRVITLVSPHVLWGLWKLNKDAITRWVVAASAVPYTEERRRLVGLWLLHCCELRSFPSYDHTFPLAFGHG